MEPQLYQLLTALIKAIRRGEDVAFEIDQLEAMLQKTKRDAPVASSAKATKMLEYIQNRKTPVTTDSVGRYFGLARSTVAKHFLELVNAGLLTKTRKSNTTYYSATGASLPVAVPDQLIAKQSSKPSAGEWVQPKVVWPVSSFQTSYPHIRGYDD